jgi:hypothetical protein
MISNTIIFIFGTLIFAIWIIGSFLEFKKMEEHPEEYQGKRNHDVLIKGDQDKE